MNDMEQRAAAREFVANWTGRGDEKQETQTFWMELLQTVYGVENPARYIAFEVPVKLSHTSFIDAYIEETRVLIEQKGADIDLRKGQKQSDGAMLTPFQQARRYAGHLPHSQYPRWIVVCNFQTFHIHEVKAYVSCCSINFKTAKNRMKKRYFMPRFVSAFSPYFV